MSSGRGRSPCDTGPREQRLDVICPGTLAAASRRNDGSGWAVSRRRDTPMPPAPLAPCALEQDHWPIEQVAALERQTDCLPTLRAEII